MNPFCIFLTFLFSLIFVQDSNQQTLKASQILPALHFNILNKGQYIKIPLDGYFPFANNYTLLDNDDKGNINQKLDVNFNLDKIQVEASQQMVGYLDSNTPVYLNLSKIYDVKSIYNQPSKLFLLQNNIIIMYSYRQKSQYQGPYPNSYNRLLQQYLKTKLNSTYPKNYPKITVVNISSVFKIQKIGNYNLNCTQMEAFPFEGGYKLILLCKVKRTLNDEIRNYVVGFNMDQENRGFIIGLSFNSSNYIEAINNNKQEESLNNSSTKEQLFKSFLFKRIKKVYRQSHKNFSKPFTQTTQDYLPHQSIHSNNESHRDINQLNDQQSCQEFHLKYFQKLVIGQKPPIYQTVVVYCNYSINLNPSQFKGLYDIQIIKKGLLLKPSLKLPVQSIGKCFLNSKYIAEFENGFLTARYEFVLRASLKFWKYETKLNEAGQKQTFCYQYNQESLLGYLFITSRRQEGVQTIYVIFSDKILIFESYSPNYQTLNITEEGLVLKSYAISNQLLSLHFEDENSTKYIIMTYNIKAMYPHLIDRVQFPKSKQTSIYLFSVMNYLQTSNYFFIYQRQTNILKLTFYQGHYVNISIKNPSNAVGYQNISIVNCSSTALTDCMQNYDTRILPLTIKIRAFCDSSIEIVPLDTIKLNSKLFNVDLVKAVLGPLGRFYKMKNPSTSLQFVNSFHEIEINAILNRFDDKKLLTFSIDTFLNEPILTFYFEDFLILECDLEFDFYLMRPLITRCVQVITENEQNPEEIIIYEQGSFMQFVGAKIFFCRISSNRDTICVLAEIEDDPIKKIKLIEYKEVDEESNFISVFIIFKNKFKQKDYIVQTNATTQKDIQIFVNLEVTQNEIPYLKSMTIRTVQYDEGYQKFLVLYMMDYFNPTNSIQNCLNQSRSQQSSSQNYSADLLNQNGLKNQIPENLCLNQTFFEIVQVYSKPQLQRNQSSNFIGHLIQQFTSTEGEYLENVFIIDNKIIILSHKQEGSTIEEYIIQDFKCLKSRNYPLYDHRVTMNGSHYVNSGFLFVEVQEDQVSKFLVYNPSLSTTNIITHSFYKVENQKLLFIQKITPSQNVMAIHGDKLITLSLPNMVVRLSQSKESSEINLSDDTSSGKQKQQDLRSENNLSEDELQLQAMLKVGFIDNNDILKVISFQYSYDISDSKIQYKQQIQNQIGVFQDPFDSKEISIDPSLLSGPVSEYSIQNSASMDIAASSEAKSICQFIEVNSSDIFTKTKCIKYIDSKADGIMQDFLTFEPQPFQDITIIVTDKKILCIQNMSVKNRIPKNKTKQCNIFQSSSDIFIVCIENNSTTINRLKIGENCTFERIWLPKPDVLKYNLFRMIISQGQAIFEVPIRSESNKVYYITEFFPNKTFNETSLTLLKHGSQEEFITKDFTTNGTFMFLLENGLGIYNLTKRNSSTKKLTPDVWISEDELMEKFKLKEELTYVNCLEFDLGAQAIILEIGTTFQSFELQLRYSYNKTTSSIYIVDVDVHYTYKNPWSCYNTLLSKSRYYKDMTIKMCSYMPQEHYIFSNFIPISENKQNSYIVFYQKNFKQKQSYPFRMDIIYTNIYSNDNFQIPMHKAKLLIGSLFNLLCEYDLRDSFRFRFDLNKKINDVIDDNQNNLELKEKCNFTLKLSNQNTQQSYDFTIKLDFESKNGNYWTDWAHWIQRVFFLLVVINYIRLEFVKRSEKARISKLKIKIGRSDSFDQTFDLQVRLHSKKSL